MLRNQDRPELLLFVTANAARWTDGVERPGVARLVAEAADAGTPSLWICEDDPKPVGGLEPTPWPANAPALPCPQALQDARASIEIEPDGFGGGMGGAGGTRGRKMPAREPLPARCVVIAPSREAAIAGRSAGMRVVGLCSEAEVTLDGAADVLFDELDDDWDAVTFDDLYTPGTVHKSNFAAHLTRRVDGAAPDSLVDLRTGRGATGSTRRRRAPSTGATRTPGRARSSNTT